MCRPCGWGHLCRRIRWSAVSEFGQRVNNYSAYSVIMVPVSLAAAEEGGPSRLSSIGDEVQAPRTALHLDIY